MKQYDVTCPLCGTINRGLFLEETDGWMECEKCHNKTQNYRFVNRNMVKIPVYTMKGLTAMMKSQNGTA